MIEQAKIAKYDDGVVRREGKADEVLGEGEEVSRDGSGRIVSKRQVIDRRPGGRYRERVVDVRTGEVLRDVDEPLSEHQERGTQSREPRP